jgi:hypothetical protein
MLGNLFFILLGGLCCVERTPLEGAVEVVWREKKSGAGGLVTKVGEHIHLTPMQSIGYEGKTADQTPFYC